MSNYQQTIDWLRGIAERGGKGVVDNIDARCLGRVADDIERLRAIAIERMDLFRQAASKVEEADARNNALVKRLEPFAKLAALFDDYESDIRNPETESVLINVRLSDVRDARALMLVLVGKTLP